MLFCFLLAFIVGLEPCKSLNGIVNIHLAMKAVVMAASLNTRGLS
ncbi:hypothetical protein BTN50_0582 [Candidatus Enterovibrio altilux]|uniref:Uncharacterized protein n=1 Tax=Candidatus Enterovibrio altilux TaxID=1927128 RepID=A0A291B816_9GAMM|nr:hypothetical protein BTN50_0582 [Candidatus Enterovibrio luxaltus]